MYDKNIVLIDRYENSRVLLQTLKKNQKKRATNQMITYYQEHY